MVMFGREPKKPPGDQRAGAADPPEKACQAHQPEATRRSCRPKSRACRGAHEHLAQVAQPALGGADAVNLFFVVSFYSTSRSWKAR
jgi:hypothetical protein